MGLKLGDISPLAGLMTGKGFTTNFGILPAIRAKNVRDDEKNEALAMAQQADAERQAQRAAQYSGGMKKGGKVSSASKRADGIAQRGKTRGRIV